jgi:hypothetical protein
MGRFYARHLGSERSQSADRAPRRAHRGQHVDSDQWIRELDESSRARFEAFLELVAQVVAHGEGGALGLSSRHGEHGVQNGINVEAHGKRKSRPATSRRTGSAHLSTDTGR